MGGLVAAAEAEAVGFGGAWVVAGATGVSRRAIRVGARELRETLGSLLPSRRIRRPGGGRKRTVTQDPTLQRDLERLIEPVTRGDPETPLRWTCKSVRRLSAELKRRGAQGESSHGGRNPSPIGIQSTGPMLRPSRGPATRTAMPSLSNINKRVRQYLAKGDPVISVDTKKKELGGEFKNGGQEFGPKRDAGAA